MISLTHVCTSQLQLPAENSCPPQIKEIQERACDCDIAFGNKLWHHASVLTKCMCMGSVQCLHWRLESHLQLVRWATNHTAARILKAPCNPRNHAFIGGFTIARSPPATGASASFCSRFRGVCLRFRIELFSRFSPSFSQFSYLVSKLLGFDLQPLFAMAAC